MPELRFKHFVDDHRDDADDRALADQAPVEVAAEHALGDGRDDRRLRRGKRGRLGARRALEGEGGVQEVEDRRDDERAEDDAEDQRDLLPPRRRLDQLAGLQILEVVVGDGRDAEDDRGHEQGEGDQRLGLVAARRRGNSAARISEMPSTDRMPTPEIGLFDAPIRPAM